MSCQKSRCHRSHSRARIDASLRRDNKQGLKKRCRCVSCKGMVVCWLLHPSLKPSLVATLPRVKTRKNTYKRQYGACKVLPNMLATKLCRFLGCKLDRSRQMKFWRIDLHEANVVKPRLSGHGTLGISKPRRDCDFASFVRLEFKFNQSPVVRSLEKLTVFAVAKPTE